MLNTVFAVYWSLGGWDKMKRTKNSGQDEDEDDDDLLGLSEDTTIYDYLLYICVFIS